MFWSKLHVQKQYCSTEYCTEIEAIHSVILTTRSLDCNMFMKLSLIDCSESSKSVQTMHITFTFKQRLRLDKQ